MNIYLITALILFTLLTIYKTRLGVYLILLLIPSFLLRTQIAGIPTTFLELSIYLLVIVWIVKKYKNTKTTSYQPAFVLSSSRREADHPLGDNKLREGEPQRAEQVTTSYKKFLQPAKPFLLPTALFIAAAIISTIISPDKRLSLGILKGWFIDPLLFTIIFINQIKNNKHINKVITALALMTLWISCYGIYEYLFNPRNLIEYLRLDSIFTSANYVTMLIMPITVLVLGYLIYSFKQSSNRTIEQLNNKTTHQWLLPLLILTTAISLTAIYLTKSFSGWLGLAAGIFIIFLFLPIKKKLKLSLISIFIIASVIFVYTQKDNPKLQSLTDFSGRSASHTRLQIWQTSLAIIKDNPILGIGLGNFHAKYLEYLPQVVESPLEYDVIKPHNLYLNLWLETGLLGLIAFIWLIIIFYKSIIRFPTSDLRDDKWIYDKWIYIPALSALLIQGLFDTPYFKNDLSLIFWLLIGLAIIKNNQKTNPC